MRAISLGLGILALIANFQNNVSADLISPAIIDRCGVYRLRGVFEENEFIVDEGTFSEYRITLTGRKVAQVSRAPMEAIVRFGPIVRHSYSPIGELISLSPLLDARDLDLKPIIRTRACK